MTPLWILITFLIAFFFGYRVGFVMGRPPPCPHNTRTTTFHGMEDLRDLFSGRITVEEYKEKEVNIVSKCADCGEVL